MDRDTVKAARILIVDDDVATACLLSNVLHRLGYNNAESINDSEQIVDKLAHFAPDLILLDLTMPKLNGFQILELLRKGSPQNACIPVIVITGEATAKNKRRLLAAGVTDLLAKPLDASEALMRIGNVLERRFLQLEIEEQNRLLEERVSERTKQLQQALGDLQSAQRQMLKQERLSAFAEMAGGVVHDFSNALMAVIGYSDILMTADGRNLESRETALEYLRIINTAGRDAAEVVSRLRDFYRPRNHADSSQAVDLNEVVHQAILLARPKWKEAARGNGKEISVEAERGDLPIVSGNPAELREMLVNLIFNAVDAMPNGGAVKIRTRERAGQVEIEISDTGTGMTAEVRARCLDPFFSTKGDQGTGLGLAMVFGIVQRHEGSIEIASAEGSGTTFRITLPALVGRAEPAHPEAARGGATHFAADELLGLEVSEASNGRCSGVCIVRNGDAKTLPRINPR